MLWKKVCDDQKSLQMLIWSDNQNLETSKNQERRIRYEVRLDHAPDDHDSSIFIPFLDQELKIGTEPSSHPS